PGGRVAGSRAAGVGGGFHPRRSRWQRHRAVPRSPAGRVATQSRRDDSDGDGGAAGSRSAAQGMRIGVDVGGTKIEAIALDGDRVLSRRRVPAARGDYDQTLKVIADLVDALRAEIGGGRTT